MNLTDIQGAKKNKRIEVSDFKNGFESRAKEKRSQKNSKSRADRGAEH